MPENRVPFIQISCNTRALELFNDVTDAGLMWFCLLCASHNEFRGLQPGQFYVSKADMAKRLHMGRDALNSHLHALEQAGLISVQVCLVGTTITVLNWEEWSVGKLPEGLRFIDEDTRRFSNPYEEPQRKAWSEIRTPSPAAVTTTDTMNRHVAEREQRNTDNTPVDSVSFSPSHADDFDRLWFAYPAQRRNRKAEAGMLYERAVKNGATIDAMMKALEADMQTVIWEGGQGKYVPGIVKWLEREAWRDYLGKKVEAPTWVEY